MSAWSPAAAGKPRRGTMRVRVRVRALSRPGGRRGGGAAAKLAGCGCPGAGDSRCVTEQMPVVARGYRLLTHQKAVRARGGFGAPGAGKPLRKSWGAGGLCSRELHGWQLPEPPAARPPASNRDRETRDRRAVSRCPLAGVVPEVADVWHGL